MRITDDRLDACVSSKILQENGLEPSLDYPRPQLVREEWMSVNGEWDFAVDEEGQWMVPGQVSWQRKIRVPFAPETEASGVGDKGFHQHCWYRSFFKAPPLKGDQRLVLHFGAVDYAAGVWVNGSLAVRHRGGYTPFSVDITDLLTNGSVQEIVVHAEDDPHDLAKPRGKQDWLEEAHSIWYPRTTGIWQTVWMERVPGTHISHLRWTPQVEMWSFTLQAGLAGQVRHDLRLRVRLHKDERVLADDTYSVSAHAELRRGITLSDPGIDDSRNELLWSPESPMLINATIELLDPHGVVLDRVYSYAGMRSIAIQGDRFVLNGRPVVLRMVLDQGYWPKTGMTPPDGEALRTDVELAKAMGFNGVRKHQKVEDPRYLYWADRLGLLVWGEMPSAYRFAKPSVDRLVEEWSEVIERDVSHPSIVAWVPFNESWGVPDLPDSPSQRHWVQAMYHLTKTLDATRPVVGNDGWESIATDIIGIHDYEDHPERLRRRYSSEESLIARLCDRERPGGRLLVLERDAHGTQPIMLTEFGGISYSRLPEAWGYSTAGSERDLAKRYTAMLRVVRSLPRLAGFCYTQFADTYQETNGLLYEDRTPKFPLNEISRATREPHTFCDPVETEWRERIMDLQMQQYRVPPEDHRVMEDR